MKSSKRIGSVMLTLGAVLALAGGVFAQTGPHTNAPSGTFGTATLVGGFTPDPFKVNNVVSGGSIDASSVHSGCNGHIAREPDVVLNYSQPASFLRIYFEASGRGASADSTLVINDGAGNWHCNDDIDTSTNRNPQVDFTSPPAGHYDIWIGSYQSGANARGKLYITELQSNSARRLRP